MAADAKADDAKIAAKLERFMALHPKRMDLTLERIDRLLAALGRPERRLPPVVHIAGTNGKGSTLAMLEAILRAAGAKTLRYVSPHLTRFNERVLIDGEPVADRPLLEALERAEAANQGAPITFFEITTAAAFSIFATTPADALLLETGLGGRLDATNVCERPALTLIAPISLDHQAFLGDTIAEIAFEKAGILRSGALAISGPQPEEAAAVLDARARALGADLRLFGRDWSFERTPEGFDLIDGAARIALPRPGLVGDHQFENAALAAMAARALPKELRPEERAIARGLREARWPARMQRLREGPLLNLAPEGCELWLDGGHNAAAGRAFAAALAALPVGAELCLVVSLLRSKDPASYLHALARLAPRVRAIPGPDGTDAWEAEAIVRAARGLGLEAWAHESASAAIGAETALARPARRIALCGSLYFAGAVLAEHR